MTPDLSLTLGIILAVFAIPAIVSALSDGRSPRVPTLVILIAGGFLIYALRANPGGYALFDVPDVVLRTAASFIS